LASGFSMSIQGNSAPGSPLVGNPSFPLADLSSVMFPNPDPFAYPNQQSGADAKFDDLLKNLGNTVPVADSFDQFPLEQSIPQNEYAEATQYMMYQDVPQPAPSQAVSQEADVQLLGPMPMYMMQGASTGGTFNYENLINTGAKPSTPPGINGSPGLDGSRSNLQRLVQRPQPSQLRNQVKRAQGPGPNVNLDDLLGGSEWAGLPADRAVVPGGFGKQNGLEITTGEPSTTQPGQYDAMNPNVLSWGFEGY